jgi:hypothetical protein
LTLCRRPLRHPLRHRFPAALVQADRLFGIVQCDVCQTITTCDAVLHGYMRAIHTVCAGDDGRVRLQFTQIQADQIIERAFLVVDFDLSTVAVLRVSVQCTIASSVALLVPNTYMYNTLPMIAVCALKRASGKVLWSLMVSSFQ